MSELAHDGSEGRDGAFQRALLYSVAAHVALLGLLLASPSFLRTDHALPGVVTVDLVALPPGPAPLPKPGPPAKPAPPKAAAPPKETPPAPVAPPKPPPPAPKEIVLPKETTKPPEKTPPPKPKAETPKPAEAPPKVKSQGSLDDVLASLREEKGESKPEAVASAVETRNVAEGGTGGGGGTVQVSPEVMAWMKSARIHVRKSWVLAPGLRSEPLQTMVTVELDAAGNVIGPPRVTKRSGNPWYDDSVVRAIQKASPLPAPPEAGEWPFLFQPEETP